MHPMERMGKRIRNNVTPRWKGKAPPPTVLRSFSVYIYEREYRYVRHTPHEPTAATADWSGEPKIVAAKSGPRSILRPL
jgi:hypothetical protein